MIGSSELVRSRAAATLGEMDRQAPENLPNLVLEAFSALRNDPYVIVHGAPLRRSNASEFLPPLMRERSALLRAGFFLTQQTEAVMVAPTHSSWTRSIKTRRPHSRKL
jgi:hypothetical protein